MALLTKANSTAHTNRKKRRTAMRTRSNTIRRAGSLAAVVATLTGVLATSGCNLSGGEGFNFSSPSLGLSQLGERFSFRSAAAQEQEQQAALSNFPPPPAPPVAAQPAAAPSKPAPAVRPKPARQPAVSSQPAAASQPTAASQQAAAPSPPRPAARSVSSPGKVVVTTPRVAVRAPFETDGKPVTCTNVSPPGGRVKMNCE